MKRWIAPIASLTLTTTPTLAQEALNTRQLEALSPKAANHQAQQDLLSILKPTGQFHRGMFRFIHGIDFTTDSHATAYAGLCSRDMMTLWYKPAEPGPATKDTALQPYSVTASTVYHFLKLPKSVPAKQDPSEAASQDHCEAAGRDDRAHWFWAKSPEMAVKSVLLLNATLKAIETGAITPTCDPKESGKQSCSAWIIANANPDDPSPIEPCNAPSGVVCYVMDEGGSIQLTIKAEDNGDELTPGKILSVDTAEFIIVT